jgi:hypothetical protein
MSEVWFEKIPMLMRDQLISVTEDYFKYKATSIEKSIDDKVEAGST